MSALPTAIFPPPRAGDSFRIKITTRSRWMRQGSVVLAVAFPLVMAACTGGAGLDVPIGPVDHSCPVSCGGHR
jgi:hypothetical protein